MARIALLGTGRIGTHHAGVLARDVPGVELIALVDPAVERAQVLADELGVPAVYADYRQLAEAEELDGVVITTPAVTHLELIEFFAGRGINVFTEKPVAVTVADAQQAAKAAEAAGIVFQVGFNRRFAESWQVAKAQIEAGVVGDIQRINSITRDPGPFGADPARVPAGTIFDETLIHDFDTINWLMAPARPVEVYAVADALIRPDAKEAGFLDSAVVTITYDNGAITTAEASFSALYGYDLRGEVFGNAGMVQMGALPSTAARTFTAAGVSAPTAGTDTSRFHDAYVGEFRAFAEAISGGTPATFPDGAAGVLAQQVAAAAIVSHAEHRPVRIEEVN